MKIADNDNDNDNDDDDDDDTHPGWIIVRVGRYSVADKNWIEPVVEIVTGPKEQNDRAGILI